ncbi:helix-turn-helix domain-containing protein [Paraburkholderia megapolitana]|uniref:helix-turn-helix domain-containing protein n=1 Tax=Paraburkholderia megapolitana TaxID=420953 RepID=UPI0038B6BB39
MKQIEAQKEGIAFVEIIGSEPHNLGAARRRVHCWSGIEVHSVRQEVLRGPAWHQLKSDCPVLSIVVNESGGRCEARLAVDQVVKAPNRDRRKVGHTSLIPGGMSIWGYSDEISRVDELRLALDPERVLEIMGGEFPLTRLDEPHLMFFDEDLQALARLLASIEGEASGSGLLGDSLTAAIIARFARLNTSRTQPPRRLGLSGHQLGVVTAFMAERLAQPVRLAELAALAGLSSSQFGRAFKVSTGVTPHRWHLQGRIDYAKRLLMDRNNSLVGIALDTGFSEQSPFTRAFRAMTGISPGAWRRIRLK